MVVCQYALVFVSDETSLLWASPVCRDKCCHIGSCGEATWWCYFYQTAELLFSWILGEERQRSSNKNEFCRLIQLKLS